MLPLQTYASLAQLVEQMTLNHLVVGSNPTGGTRFHKALLYIRFKDFFLKCRHRRCIRRHRMSEYCRQIFP